MVILAENTVQLYIQLLVEKSEINKQAVWLSGLADTLCPHPPLTLTFDLETGMQVASKVRNLPSKFGHARPLGSGIIQYVRDGWMDGQK